ncbi:hypothetical protein C7M84_023976 [Penaeus vannamei]|uniref:Uncharacterized protein n=1 Tax=Penaeus vannamei TaxID=6689 RepID=A0A423U2C6_PENVA|nr:hypothetical protein C7M84_023976 [Penaeus vannamei]
MATGRLPTHGRQPPRRPNEPLHLIFLRRRLRKPPSQALHSVCLAPLSTSLHLTLPILLFPSDHFSSHLSPFLHIYPYLFPHVSQLHIYPYLFSSPHRTSTHISFHTASLPTSLHNSTPTLFASLTHPPRTPLLPEREVPRAESLRSRSVPRAGVPEKRTISITTRQESRLLVSPGPSGRQSTSRQDPHQNKTRDQWHPRISDMRSTNGAASDGTYCWKYTAPSWEIRPKQSDGRPRQLLRRSGPSGCLSPMIHQHHPGSCPDRSRSEINISHLKPLSAVVPGSRVVFQDSHRSLPFTLAYPLHLLHRTVTKNHHNNNGKRNKTKKQRQEQERAARSTFPRLYLNRPRSLSFIDLIATTLYVFFCRLLVHNPESTALDPRHDYAPFN